MEEPEAAAAAQEKPREEANLDAPVAADTAVRSSTSPPLPPSSPLASGSAPAGAEEESASAELATIEVASAAGAEDRVKGPWSPEEDVILSRLVSRFGARNWSLIARRIPGRSGKSCRLRWCNQLDPYVKRRPFTDPAQMQTAKHALHVATPPAIVVCREEEQKNILEFCKSCLQQCKAGSLYVCGCPGTGKTLSIGKVKEYFLGWSKEVGVLSPDVLSINCTSLTSTSEIFSQMLVKFKPLKRKATNTSPLQHLQDIFSLKKHQSGRMLLMIADEMDYLITKDRAVLHDLFMLTTLPFSRFILIGIANAIDLADRFLQKLESLNCKPVVITFRAYSKDQILKILQQRIMALGYDVFEPAALEYCARKVAAASGDIRRALDICRCAIEVLEAELRGSVTNKETEMVSFHHIDIAISRSFKSPMVDIIQSLPQHQQVILCSFVRLSQHCKKNATTLAELNRSYSEICKSTQIPPVGMMDFASLCSALNDQGLLEMGQSRGDKSKKIKLKVDSSDISFALKGIRFFQNCFA